MEEKAGGASQESQKILGFWKGKEVKNKYQGKGCSPI